MAGEHLEPHGGIFDRFDWKRPTELIMNLVFRGLAHAKGRETAEAEMVDWFLKIFGRVLKPAVTERFDEALGETEH